MKGTVWSLSLSLSLCLRIIETLKVDRQGGGGGEGPCYDYGWMIHSSFKRKLAPSALANNVYIGFSKRRRRKPSYSWKFWTKKKRRRSFCLWSFHPDKKASGDGNISYLKSKSRLNFMVKLFSEWNWVMNLSHFEQISEIILISSARGHKQFVGFKPENSRKWHSSSGGEKLLGPQAVPPFYILLSLANQLKRINCKNERACGWHCIKAYLHQGAKVAGGRARKQSRERGEQRQRRLRTEEEGVPFSRFSSASSLSLRTNSASKESWQWLEPVEERRHEQQRQLSTEMQAGTGEEGGLRLFLRGCSLEKGERERVDR